MIFKLEKEMRDELSQIKEEELHGKHGFPFKGEPAALWLGLSQSLGGCGGVILVFSATRTEK